MRDTYYEFASLRVPRVPTSSPESPMKEVLNDINRWQSENEAIALATVIETW